jgi:hypothetical protein
VAGLEQNRRGRRRGFGVFCGYLLVSVWLWRSLVPHLATRTLGGGLLDPGLFIWWLKWTPYALTHGLNPFRSTYLDAPDGISAMWNTSVLGLGVLFAPVTLLFGAVVSFNLACILGPPLSAWTAWLWLRRHVRDVSAMIGGLVFGFSPFVIAQSRAGHLNFTWLFLLPVILMLVEDLLWRSPRPRRPQAPLLGLVVALQLLIGSEALLIFTLGCAGLALLLGVSNPRAAWHRLRVLLPAAAIATGVGVALCAWPLLEQFGGDRAVSRPVQPIGSVGGRLAMLVGAPQGLAFHTGRGPKGHLTSVENGLYIGWPLLALLGVTVALLVRRPGVLIAAAAVIVSAEFQMYGARRQFAGHSVPAPLNVLQHHLGITGQIQPGRFAIVMWFAIAWLLAVFVNTSMARVPKRWSMAPVLVAAACLLPLLPGPAAPTLRLAATPSLFTTSLRRTIPNGSTVMIAPMATVENGAAELWQVATDMRFRQLGGYMLHAVGPSRRPSYSPSARVLTTLFRIDSRTRRAYSGKMTVSMLDAARAELLAAGVTLFMVGYSRCCEPKQLLLAELLLGRPADRRIGGVSIWGVTTTTTGG